MLTARHGERAAARACGVDAKWDWWVGGSGGGSGGKSWGLEADQARSGSRSSRWRWRLTSDDSGSSTNARGAGGGRRRQKLPATASSARAPARQHRSPSCKLCTDLGRARNTTLPDPIPTTNRLTSELTCDHIYPPARSVGGAGEGADPGPSCEPEATWDVGAPRSRVFAMAEV